MEFFGFLAFCGFCLMLHDGFITQETFINLVIVLGSWTVLQAFIEQHYEFKEEEARLKYESEDLEDEE